MAFSITNILNEESLQEATETVDTKKISYDKLIPHEKNIYHILPADIEDLADSIEDSGLLQNLVVKPLDDGTYKIIAGHRRWNAIKLLVEKRGKSEYSMIPCKVTDKDETEVKTLLKLHNTNLLARTITEYERMEAIKELKNIYKELDKKGEKPKGKIRDLISEQVGIKPTQVQKYMTIAENADEETKEALRENEITVEQAYEQSKNPEAGEKKEKKPKDMKKEIKKQVIKLRELLETDESEQKLYTLIREMETIILEREE